MPDTIDDARQMIESRLADLEAEARQLERALSHLRGVDDHRPRRRKANARSAFTSISQNGRRKPSRRKAGKRARRGQRRDELLAAIGADPEPVPSSSPRRSVSALRR